MHTREGRACIGGMSKRILVGFDPRSADRAPIAFGVAAARFTGAPLTIASAHADHAAIGHAHHSVDAGLADEASDSLEQLHSELAADHIAVDCRALPGL